MMSHTAHVPHPQLDLHDGTPVSVAFGDVYFSRAGGVAETEHVFLSGNGLPERWCGRGRFTIGELGFGTGLNFLVAWKRFRATAGAGAVLHYIAIEKYPFSTDILRTLLAQHGELATEIEALLAAYPLRLPGIHRIHLPQAVLTLCVGDVAAMIAELAHGHLGKPPSTKQQIDAWFLDGFSPAKNPDMWTPEILAQLRHLSAPGATLATFTSAGAVRRALADAGFMVEKVAGYGHKREMSVARFMPDRGIIPNDACPSSVLILGAGIAGATLARALAERGHAVTVIDRGDVASGASGNAAGVLFPQLTKQWNLSSAWYVTAYGFMLRQLQRWRAQGLAFDGAMPGMLRLPRHAEEEAQLYALNETLGIDPAIVHWLPRDAASAQAGIALPTGAAFFPQGSWVSPAQLCHALLQHASITVRSNSAAASLTRSGVQWAVTLANGEILTADTCCVATAQESAQLLAEYGIRLNAVGGQVTEIATGTAAHPLRSILCHKGYVIPRHERILIGATYHREDMLAVTDARHEENLAELHALLPDFPHGKVVAGRSALRATTPDRLPYIGAVAEGLYVSTGHGSRGLLSAPLAAEMIAAEMSGECTPVSAALAQMLRPLRFATAIRTV